MPGLINPYLFASSPPPPAGFTLVGVGQSLMATADDISVSFDDPVTLDPYAPVEGDIVIIGGGSTTNGTVTVAGTGFTQIGSLMIPGDTTFAAFLAYHVVDAADVTGGFDTYGMLNVWNATKVGENLGAIIRGVDDVSPLDAVGPLSFSASNATPHVLGGIPDTDVDTGSLVIAYVCADDLSTYTEPAGWDMILQGGTNQGCALLIRDDLTTSGVAVATTNITPSLAGEYVSYAVALSPAA